LTDGHELAEIFAKFFTEKVNKLARLDARPINNIIKIKPLHPIEFTLDDLKSALKQIKNKKCHGTDGLPLKLIKDFVALYPNLVLELFNEISKNGMPENWRTARVIPLFKSGNKLDVSNYRPISNLQSLSKVYEKLLLKKLNDETHNLEGNSQHDFRKHHSTTTACLELQSVITEAMDRGEYAVVYSIDMSAAFDLLRKDILMDEIEKRGNITEGLAFLIRDFLDERKMITEVDGKRSQEKELQVG